MNHCFALPALLILAASLAVSCGDGDASKSKGADVAPTLGLPEMARPASWTTAKADLGKKLFFDTRLSSNGKMSCSTCHEPHLGWTDGQRFSTKVDGKVNTRNSPSLLNVGYQSMFYWDGRADTLEKNVAAAWKGHMGGDADKMASELGKIAGYQKEFESAFGGAPTGDTMVEALASFVRNLVSGGSRYDRFKAGDSKALSADEQAGMNLFMSACVICHTIPLFTDHGFHNIGVGMEVETPDPGRHKVDENAPLGSFKTPSLRSVSKTAPYFHDGSAANLTEAVTIMAQGGKPNAALDPMLMAVKVQNFDKKKIDLIVAFLGALEGSDTFEKPTLPQ